MGETSRADLTIAALLGIDANWTIFFLLGLVVIALFARDQLNQRLEIDQNERRLAGVIELFAPAQLRNGLVFFKGYIAYAGLLIIIYTLLSVGGASAIKLAVAEETGGPDLDAASTPLIAALAIVGLGPRTPLLSHIERHLRGMVHRAVGIPSNFSEFTETLCKLKLNVAVDEIALKGVLGERDTASLIRVLSRAEQELGDGAWTDSFEQDVAKLYLFRAWQSGQAAWPSWRVRSEFQRFESALAPEILAIVEDLEDFTAPTSSFSGAAEATEHSETGSVDQRNASLARESRWRALVERAHAATQKACALFALYAERADTLPENGHAVSTEIRKLILRAQEARAANAPKIDILALWLLTTATMMFVIGAVGHWFEVNPIQGVSWAAAGALWAFSIAALYGPASLAALSIRQALVNRGSWRNAFCSKVFPTIQYLEVFALCYFTAALMMPTYIILVMMFGHLDSIAEVGKQPDIEHVFNQFVNSTDGLLSPLHTSLLFALCGGAHGVALALAADASQPRAVTGTSDGVPQPSASRFKRRLVVMGHGAALAAMVWLVNQWNGVQAAANQRDQVLEMARQIASERIDNIKDSWTPSTVLGPSIVDMETAANVPAAIVAAMESARGKMTLLDRHAADRAATEAGLGVAGAFVALAPASEQMIRYAVAGLLLGEHREGDYPDYREYSAAVRPGIMEVARALRNGGDASETARQAYGVLSGVVSAAADARRKFSHMNASFADSVARRAALDVSVEAVKAANEVRDVSGVALLLIDDAAGAKVADLSDELDRELSRAEAPTEANWIVRQLPASWRVLPPPASWAVPYQALSAGLFGWISAWSVMAMLGRWHRKETSIDDGGAGQSEPVSPSAASRIPFSGSPDNPALTAA